MKSKPQHYDIMFEYWGTKIGMSVDTLMTTDPEQTLDINGGANGDVSEALSTPIDSDQDESSRTTIPSEKLGKKRPFSVKEKNIPYAPSSRGPTQAESLLRGLEAVGNGLSAIGSSVGSVDANNRILHAINQQTEALQQQSAAMNKQLAALERQTDQMAQLLQLMANKST